MSILFLKNIENSPKFSGIKLYFAAIRFSAFGTQAVFNVILGERYKTVTKEFKGLVKGSYGKTPAPIDPEFRKKILGDEQPIDCRPADLIEPELEKLKAECAKWSQQDEDVLSYAMFGQVAEKFFEKRKDKQLGIDAEHADKANKVMPV